MNKVNTLAITVNGFLTGDLAYLMYTLQLIGEELQRRGMTEIRLDISDVTDDLE